MVLPSLPVAAILCTLTTALPNIRLDTIRSGEAVQRRTEVSVNGTLTPNHYTWEAPGADDSRGPCPVLNTLSNHGFFPHDGRNIDQATFQTALKESLNINRNVSFDLFELVLETTPELAPKTFDLSFLHVHNWIEHDGSLSRRDAIFDPRNPFDEATFSNLLRHYGDAQEFTIAATADARARQAYDMSLLNP